MASRWFSLYNACSPSHCFVLPLSVSAHAYVLVFPQLLLSHHYQPDMSDTPSQIPCRDTCHEASASSSTPSTTPAGLSSHIDQAEGASIQEKGQHRRLRESGRLLLRAQLKDEGQDRTSVTKAVNLYDHDTATLAINDLFSYIRHRLKNHFLEQWLRQARQTLACQLPPGSDATNN